MLKILKVLCILVALLVLTGCATFNQSPAKTRYMNIELDGRMYLIRIPPVGQLEIIRIHQ